MDPACVGLAFVWQNHKVIKFRETDKLNKRKVKLYGKRGRGWKNVGEEWVFAMSIYELYLEYESAYGTLY